MARPEPHNSIPANQKQWHIPTNHRVWGRGRERWGDNVGVFALAKCVLEFCLRASERGLKGGV